MFSESGSFCFMGMSSNSPVFLSDKDPKPKGNNNNINMDPEFGLLVRSAKEIHKEGCQTSTPEEHPFNRLEQLSVQERDQQEEDHKDHQEEQNQRDDNDVIATTAPVAPLKLKKLEIPSHVGGISEMNDDDSNYNDGFKTPTSSDHKIPPILECPGAPRRKTKTRRPSTKRKAAASCRRRLVFDFDLPKELESLFPTPLMVDLGSGDENKRVKMCSGD